MSTSELVGASNRMYNCLTYVDENEIIELLEQIKLTNVKQVKKAVADFEKLIDNSNYIVVAPDSMIEKNKNLFDTVMPLN